VGHAQRPESVRGILFGVGIAGVDPLGSLLIMNVYHAPPHVFLDNAVYMLSAGTYRGVRYIETKEKKQVLLQNILENVSKFQYELYGWVILDNHYHMLARLPQAGNLAKFVNSIHGRSAYEINRIDNCRGRKVWYNYWDTCIRAEKDFYTRLNYIHYNPLKHGYVNSIEKLSSYSFSSFPEYVKRNGKEWVEDIFIKFPVTDFQDKNDQ